MARPGSNGVGLSEEPPRSTPTDLDGHVQSAIIRVAARLPWWKILLAVFACAGAVLGTYKGIESAIADRPTDDEARTMVQRRIDIHRDAADPHPPITKVLDKLEANQDAIRDQVKEQGAKLDSVLEAIREMRADVRRMRRDR